ncbi:unnamed protein product [Symbiodinium sp. KB8]|nr:unnamed protein product [Symbiodinium sp. KB8]
MPGCFLRSAPMLGPALETPRTFKSLALVCQSKPYWVMVRRFCIPGSWSWQIMLNGFCPRDAAIKVSGLTFSGPLCSAAEVDLENCPEYADLCGKWGRCTTWMCMNCIPCQLLPFDLRTFNAAATIQGSSATWPLGNKKSSMADRSWKTTMAF